MRRRLAALTLATLLPAGLSGCSGDESSDAAPPASETPATADDTSPASEASTSAPATTEAAATDASEPEADELRTAVETYSDAFLTGDAATAYDTLSARCQDRTPEADFEAIVDAAAAAYGSALKLETYNAEVNGEQARVTYTYAVSAINQTDEPWARENGTWHNDDC